MKDHRKAEIVNEITALAERYAGTQQLRQQMSGAVLAYIAEQDRDTRHACADAVAAIPGETGDDLIDAGIAHAACMNARAL